MSFIDTAMHRILNGEVNAGMSELMSGLYNIKLNLTTYEWRDFIKHVCAMHPINTILMKDPLTYRARSKPRGYAGDAV
ncbi:MAG: hypothetical protein H7833_16035 [Magnetococcus sp. DMHC-1]